SFNLLMWYFAPHVAPWLRQRIHHHVHVLLQAPCKASLGEPARTGRPAEATILAHRFFSPSESFRTLAGGSMPPAQSVTPPGPCRGNGVRFRQTSPAGT